MTPFFLFSGPYSFMAWSSYSIYSSPYPTPLFTLLSYIAFTIYLLLYLWSVSFHKGNNAVCICSLLPPQRLEQGPRLSWPWNEWMKAYPLWEGTEDWGVQNSWSVTNSHSLCNQVLFTGFNVSFIISCALGEVGSRRNIIFPQGRSWTTHSLWFLLVHGTMTLWF